MTRPLINLKDRFTGISCREVYVARSAQARSNNNTISIIFSSRELIRLPTREAYDQAVMVKESSWDPKFVEYYKTYVENKIDMSGWWKAK